MLGSFGAPYSIRPWCERMACSSSRRVSSGKSPICRALSRIMSRPRTTWPIKVRVLGVLGLDRVVVEFPELADVVEDGRSHDHVAVERRVQRVVIFGVMLDQEGADPRHAPDVLGQAAAETVVEQLRRRHLLEKFGVFFEDLADQEGKLGLADVLVDEAKDLGVAGAGGILRALDEVEEVVAVFRILGDDLAALDDLDLRDRTSSSPPSPGAGTRSRAASGRRTSATGRTTRSARPSRPSCRGSGTYSMGCRACRSPVSRFTSVAKNSPS